MADPLLQADASKDNLIEQIQDLQERMDELERFALTKYILADLDRAISIYMDANIKYFPKFIPIQAAQQINGGTTDIPLSIMTSSDGPAVGEIGVGGGSNDVYMAGGFYVPDDYGGGIHHINLIFRIPDSGGTGTVDIDTNAMRMPLTPNYWTTSTPDTNSYEDSSLSGYSTSRMYYAYSATLTLQAKDFVSIWSAYYASTSTFDREVRFAGWYVE